MVQCTMVLIVHYHWYTCTTGTHVYSSTMIPMVANYSSTMLVWTIPYHGRYCNMVNIQISIMNMAILMDNATTNNQASKRGHARIAS